MLHQVQQQIIIEVFFLGFVNYRLFYFIFTRT